MRRKTIKILIVFFALTFSCFPFNNSIENGWKGIRPLKTEKKIVEKILGSPKASKDEYYNYKTANFFAQINYTTAPCENNSYERGKYNVPENTVLDYNVILYKQIKLSDLKFQRTKYRREVDSEMIGSVRYINTDNTIIISVGTKNGIEYVGEIRFYPSQADEKKFQCKNSKSETANAVKDSMNFEIASKIKFSSVHTKLGSEECKPLVEPTIADSKVPYICNGYKDYKVYVDTRGVGNFHIGREITKDINSWSGLGLPSFLLGLGEEKFIEWRLADGEPFACIIRVRYDRRDVNPTGEGRANEIIVRSLKGFAPINFTIDTYQNYGADEEARSRADAGYGKL